MELVMEEVKENGSKNDRNKWRHCRYPEQLWSLLANVFSCKKED
jgi:hypothetical protein